MESLLAPEMVLGKIVFDSDGGLVGNVVDVGVLGWGRVKFLLVDSMDEDARYRRLGVELIDAVGAQGVFLKPSPA